MTRYCSSTDDGCGSGSPRANSEFRPQGYFYIVRIGAAAVGTPVTVQIYDPAYVNTGQRCESRPGTPGSNNLNPYATTDAIARYQTSSTPNAFCNGDSNLTNSAGGTTEIPTVTSFAMRSPIDTYVPANAPVMSGCVKQYPGYGSSSVNVNAVSTEQR